MLDEAAVAPGYVRWRVRIPVGGKQALTGQGMMADAGVPRPGAGSRGTTGFA